jgi:hypothetical protein
MKVVVGSLNLNNKLKENFIILITEPVYTRVRVGGGVCSTMKGLLLFSVSFL